MAKEELSHRRHAIQMVSALPDDTQDALIVIEVAKRLVLEFLSEPEPTQKPAPVVRLIDGGIVGGPSCRST
jgi:hypothetical protein